MVATVFDSYISTAPGSLGYEYLKSKQEETIQCALGKDIIVALPMEYGKDLEYCCLPHVFDKLKTANKRPSVFQVACTWVVLIKDQVALCCSMGLTAAYMSNKCGE